MESSNGTVSFQNMRRSVACRLFCTRIGESHSVLSTQEQENALILPLSLHPVPNSNLSRPTGLLHRCLVDSPDLSCPLLFDHTVLIWTESLREFKIGT